MRIPRSLGVSDGGRERGMAYLARERFTNMPKALCPSCWRRVNLGPRTEPGQMLSCPHCAADLEVIKVNPPVLDWALQEWGDDGGDDEDEWPQRRHRWARVQERPIHRSARLN